MPRLLFAGAFFVFERNFGAIGEPLDGFDKIEAFIFLDEREDVAAFVATEAMKNLPMRIDVEAGSFLFVKRAEGDKVRAGALQRDIGTDDIDDITGSANLFERGGRKQAGHATGHTSQRAK